MPEGTSDVRYARAAAIAHEALERAPEVRAAYLDVRCGSDEPLRREVEWLITASDDSALDAIPPVIVATAEALEAGLRIRAVAPGHYRLIECLGEGGMGVVWLAEREIGEARQLVALKRLRAGAIPRQARFSEEQRILAGLNHPNIAHLVDAGVDADGEPFLAMEYVLGERIDRWCDARDLGLRARLALFLKVCAAVSYAHEQLVIHRDLKPANILVTGEGEPKLLDFGIARLIDADAVAAHTTRAMTLAYASPEQIEGAPLGTATDVWSLGVVLYELVAGAHPFRHITTDHARANAILSSAIAPPSQCSQRVTAQTIESGEVSPVAGKRRIPADIDAIVMKALRREPAQRHASVREFAQDVERFLAARPVHARRGQWTYRAQRFVQRNRWALALVAALMAIVGGFTWRTLLAEREARLQAEVADRTTDFLVSAFSLSDPTQAERYDFSAREVLDRGRERVNQELAGQPRVRARLLEALGNAYGGINEGDIGAPLLEEAARLDLDPVVNDPLAAARSLRAKVRSIHAVSGSSDEAEDAAQRAFDLVRRHGGGNDLLLADAYETLAQASNSLAAARQALMLREAAQAGPMAIARSWRSLCRVHSSLGDREQALADCERARRLLADADATRTSDYLAVLAQLQSTLEYIGNHYDRALAISRERIALTRELFGEDSSTLATLRVRLAMPLSEQGWFDEAATALAEGTPVLLRHHGEHSFQYALAVFHAGWLRFHLGEFDAAVLQLRQARDLHESLVDGHDKGRLLVLRTTLAQALIESGHADAEARGLLEGVIADRSAVNERAVGLAYARLPLARWHVASREYAEADTLLDQVESAGVRVEPELRARAAATRAAIARARGDEASALEQDRSAYEITRDDQGASNPRTARHALAYARALRAAGDDAAAQMLEREYRPIVESAYPPDSAFRRLLTDR